MDDVEHRDDDNLKRIFSMNPLWCLLAALLFQGGFQKANASSKEFRPRVICICTAVGFDFTLETTEQFNGTVHPVNRTGCTINGIGKNKTHYMIPFISGDFCNVQYDHASGTYSVKIEVNEHRILNLLNDRTFEFSCQGKAPRTFETSTKTALIQKRRKPLEPAFAFYDGDTKVNDVIYGNSYNLKAYFGARDNSTSMSYRIANCFAYDGANTSVQIVDGGGCSTNCNLINDFIYYPNSTVEAYIPNMFRFPRSNKVQIRCSIVRQITVPDCQTKCGKPTDIAFDNTFVNESDLLTDLIQIHKKNLPPDAELQKLVATATVITADRVLSSPASDALIPEVTCTPNGDFSFLRNVCIVLCAAFLAGCTINIVFCCVYLMKRKSQCRCGKKTSKAKKKAEEAPDCDFWIKEKAVPKAANEDTFDVNEWSRKPLDRPSSVKSYATVRQKVPHHHHNLSQIPLRFSQSVAESPSMKSTDSSQTSTFGVRPLMPNSYTIDTDLNSLHSSISTDKPGGYFMKNGEFSTQFNLDTNFLTNLSSGSKEAYSIL